MVDNNFNKLIAIFEMYRCVKKSKLIACIKTLCKLHFTKDLFAILGTTMSVNVAIQEGDHGCYHHLPICFIKPNLEKYLSNLNEFN